MELLLIAIVILILCAFVIAGWLGSNKILAVNNQELLFDQKVLAVHENTYTIQGSAFATPGIIGGYNSEGKLVGIFSGPTALDEVKQVSSRTLDATYGTVESGDVIALRSEIWLSDPKEAFGLAFEDVQYATPLGNMPGWYVPGVNKNRWTILVHGIESDRNAMLHVLPIVHETGNSALLINYRNDHGAPASPDGYNHISDTEWQDLQAAVAYALDHGAKDIRLFGVSLGGSVVENYLRRAGNADCISKVILDSPALNWGEILRFRLRQGGYPTILFYPSAYFAWLRAGVHIRRISTHAADIAHQTLLIHSSDDPSVPQATSKRIAEVRPDLITFLDFKHGAHARSWNYDRARYEEAVRAFLS